MTIQERDRLERDAEKFRELEGEIDRLKEQAGEAVRLLSIPAKGMTHDQYLKFCYDRDAFLDQNSTALQAAEQGGS
jgi:hypothetical protein